MTRGPRREARRTAGGRRHHVRSAEGGRARRELHAGGQALHWWSRGGRARQRDTGPGGGLVDLYQWWGQSHCLATGQVMGKASGAGGGTRQAREWFVFKPCPMEEGGRGSCVEVEG
jgi:hypothetical protein